MAVGQVSFPVMHPVTGIALGTTLPGIKQQVRDDILLIQMVETSTCAAVFTKNAFCAAPVVIARRKIDACASLAVDQFRQCECRYR